MQHECIIEYLFIQKSKCIPILTLGQNMSYLYFYCRGFTGHGTIKLFEYLKWNL